MCSTPFAQPRVARQRLRIAAWLSVVGVASTAWGCRVKRVDPGGPTPAASTAAVPAAPAPSSSAQDVTVAKAPGARPRAPAAAASSPAPAAKPLEAPREAKTAAPSTPPELPPFEATELPAGVAAVAFSGPGTDPEQTPSLVNAVRHALRSLTQESSPLEAALTGTTILESDPSLNASTGAALRLDGNAELEVMVMDSSGRMGAAAALRKVQHPVRVALAAASSPHRLLVGEGAERVAHWLGLPVYEAPTPRQLETYALLMARFAPGQPSRADATVWGTTGLGPGANAWQAYLKLSEPEPKPEPRPEPEQESGTTSAVSAEPPVAEAPPTESSASAVAILVRAGPGAFAGAIETGGAWLALPGSVGAIATPGAALHVASRGAVALSGPDERMIARALARRTYDKLLAFQSARAAATWALEQAEGRPISIAVMDALNIVTMSNAPTAWAKADPKETASAAVATEGASR